MIWLAVLPGIVTSCLLAWILYRVLASQDDERSVIRASHDIRLSALIADNELQVSRLHAEMSKLYESHRQEMAAINQARCEEVSQLCQRIQAPEHAVIAHAVGTEQQKPPLDLEDDLKLVEEQKARLRGLGILSDAA